MNGVTCKDCSARVWNPFFDVLQDCVGNVISAVRRGEASFSQAWLHAFQWSSCSWLVWVYLLDHDESYTIRPCWWGGHMSIRVNNWNESSSLLQDGIISLNDEFQAFVHQFHIAICYEDLRKSIRARWQEYKAIIPQSRGVYPSEELAPSFRSQPRR